MSTASSSPTYQGRCFCGAVELSVSGEPAGEGFCHCASCRSWSAGPVNAFTLWKPDAVKITKGAEHVGAYRKTPKSDRKFCRICGGHLLTEHPAWSLVDVYAAAIPTYKHKPQLHVHYQETVLPMKDGLPKMKDLPKEMGGSGETLPE
ncbi:MAG: GFA family protein [Betaproteobacteria bacterium]